MHIFVKPPSGDFVSNLGNLAADAIETSGGGGSATVFRPFVHATDDSAKYC
jgi:hypothetical protein